MFSNNSADSVPAVYLTFLDDMLNVSEDSYNWGVDSTILLVLQALLFMSRAIRLHSLCFASILDVILDMIPDRETELNHFHSSQLRLFYFIFTFYWQYRCRIEKPPLGGPVPQLRPLFGVKWTTKYLFKYTSWQRGPRYFRDHFEKLRDQSINWTSYVIYHDDMPWVYHLYYNL
jgi:hypothetical protein